MCGQRIEATIGGRVVIVNCSRTEGHPHDHWSKLRWPPRFTPPPGRQT